MRCHPALIYALVITDFRFRSTIPKGKGIQVGKKSKTTDLFEKLRSDLGASAQESAPLTSGSQPLATAEKPSSTRVSSSIDREAIHVTFVESISAKLSREGSLQSLSVKGDLQIRISDPALAKVKLEVVANATYNAQFRTHPKVDKAKFTKSKVLQMGDSSKGFPVNQALGVLRWNATASADATDVAPIMFTVWVNKGASNTCNLTVEYEMTGSDSLKDVVLIVPYSTSEPAVSSFDAVYEVSGDTLEWTIGNIDGSNPSGSFEFEANTEDEAEFFPMSVQFSKSNPFIDVDVSVPKKVNEEHTNIDLGLFYRFDGAGPRCVVYQGG